MPRPVRLPPLAALLARAAAALCLTCALARGETLESAECTVTFPGHARAVAERIVAEFPRRRAGAARWLGLEPVGRPRIHLVEDYAGMRLRAGVDVPEWAVAIARRDDVLVFRLDRIGRTPATSLEQVLTHEVVHQVLSHLRPLPVGRALPRWFEEGLCVHHAGMSYLEPDTSLERMAAGGHLPTFAEAERGFFGNALRAATSYKLGGAVVKEFVRRFGDGRLRELLQRVVAGRSFEGAFRDATGIPLARFEAEWRDSVTPSLPFLVFILLENIELSLLCFGALLVFLGYLRWRFKRERAMQQLGDGF